jgi:lysophospholipase L1-like esterase
LLWILLCLFFFCSASPRGVIILCAGDSITESAYPQFLQKILQREGIKAKVLNYGRSGHTSSEYLKFLQKNKKTLDAERPDFVLLELGTNDVRADGDFTSTDRFKLNMKEIIGIFREFRNRSGQEAILFLATIPPVPTGTPFPFTPESIRRVTEEINPAIKKICEEEKILMVDNYSIFLHSPELLPQVHPSQDGYRRLAQNWFSALKPLLPK